MGTAVLYGRLMREAYKHPVCGGLTCDRSTTRGGYIQMWGNPRTYAHRVAWEANRGPIPPGMRVCHRCDQPNCFDVRHLFLGTDGDNNADRDAKGRGVTPNTQGVRHGRHKLTDEQVLAIRRSADPGKVLAERYGVNKSCVSKIRTGKSWRHLTAGARDGRETPQWHC